MTLAERRNVVNIILICFHEMFYRIFLSLNVLKTRFFFVNFFDSFYQEFFDHRMTQPIFAGRYTLETLNQGRHLLLSYSAVSHSTYLDLW